MEKSSDLKTVLGKWLRDLRNQKGITQEHLAEIVGISPKYYSEVERGRRNITVNNLQRIMDGLGISTADLLEFLLKSTAQQGDSELLEQVSYLLAKGNKKTKRHVCQIIQALMQ